MAVLNDDRRNSFVGRWWLPGERGRALTGTLDIGERVELKLYESTNVPRTANP